MSLFRLDDFGVSIGGVRLVEGLSLSIAPGEAVALAGESGSGKSLTCFTPFGLSGLAASGSARLGGTELVGMAERDLARLRAAQVGFVFQQPATALTPHLTVRRHLVEAATQAGGAKPSRGELEAMLERVGLKRGGRWLGRYPHQLSGGERQRLCLAMAVAHGPRLLVADEPTSALDAALRAEVMALIDGLRRDEGVGLLIASHDLAGLERHADRICILRGGRLVEAGPAARLMRKPESDYASALIAATPRVDGPVEARPAPADSDGAPLVAAEKVTVRFPRSGFGRPPLVAVDDASLAVARGETLAIVGGSGSGKSTLGRAIVGLGPMQSGRILWEGEPLPPRGRRGRGDRVRMQPVFQDPFASLDPKWPLARTVAEPLRHLRPGMTRAERHERAVALLAETGLDAGMADRLPAEVSGGQAQRVAIARALAPDPDFLLLDEATSALDPLVAQAICELLLGLQEARGLAILMITHDIALARRMAHRIAVTHEGRIVETGPAGRVVAEPEEEATRRLVAASL